MTVEKFIRILGYIVYCILWSPVIAVLLPILPIAWLVVFTRIGLSTKESMSMFKEAMKNSIRHDMEFIRTGIWY